jgi:hypothetical protein
LEHIGEYFALRGAEMAELSVAPDTEAPFASRDDHNGRMFTRLGLSERSFLAVNERVVIEHGVKHRISYAYYLITDEAEVWAYERGSLPLSGGTSPRLGPRDLSMRTRFVSMGG